MCICVCALMCLGIQLWTDCRELRELQMLSALSAPLASPLYSANWPEVKNSLGWPGRDWFTDFMYKVNTLSGGELNSLHHILTSYLPPDLSCYFNPAIFNTTACFCLTGVTQVKRWSNYPNMWFIFKKKKKMMSDISGTSLVSKNIDRPTWRRATILVHLSKSWK